jgi:SAM-dependent methyltransferase/glycosyltransferase involved in cell wall biosynthesis
MRVILFGTYDTSMHPRIATLGAGLRDSGIEVAECNAPLGLDTAGRVAMLAQPWRGPALLIRLARRWATLARSARRLPVPDAVLVGYVGHFDVHLARLLFRKVPIVLDHLAGASDTGRDRRLDGGPRQALLRLIDAAALRAADVVLVDTEEQRATLPGRYRRRAVVVPVGAPAAWFAAGAAAAAPAAAAGDGPSGMNHGPLRVVFYGLYTPLQGTPVIGAALSLLAGTPIEVTMIGTGQDAAAARAAAAANGGVRWLDWVPAADLPAVVASHHVCLGIFGTGGKARRVVPNKVFQGAAAGCAIVTSDTAPQRRTLGGAAVLVPPGDPGALAGALRQLAGDPAALGRLRGAARELAAGQFAPSRVVAPLLRTLGPVPAPAGPGERPGLEAPLTPNAWLRYDVVARMLPAGVRDVLEVGCGQGALGVRLAQRYDYLGLEPDPASCMVAERRIKAAGRGEVRNIRVDALGPEQFDLVCAFEVLEHIDDDAAAVRQWAARLRPGGWLMLSVPAHQRRYGPADELVGHFRRYDPAALAALLAGCGLTDIEVRQYGFPLGYALEAGRNLIGRRRLAAAPARSVAELTAASGRLLQPASRARGAATRYGTAPFRALQRSFPGTGTGTGLVVLARLAR